MQLEIADDVLIEGPDFVERFEHVERNVRLELFVGLPDAREIVLDAERMHLVTELVTQRAQDVVFGSPGRGLEIVAGDVGRRDLIVVHQDEHAQLAHRGAIIPQASYSSAIPCTPPGSVAARGPAAPLRSLRYRYGSRGGTNRDACADAAGRISRRYQPMPRSCRQSRG